MSLDKKVEKQTDKFIRQQANRKHTAYKIVGFVVLLVVVGVAIGLAV